MLESCLTAALGGDGPAEARNAAALRLRVPLDPVGGPGAKIMPPTYAGDDGPIYVHENRLMGDREVVCVLLDSVASQGNRLEAGLLDAMDDGRVAVPDVVVDQGEFGRNSALRFAHRTADAWIEDALLDGRPFGGTPQHAALSSVINRGVALPLLEQFPVGLLLGVWASRKRNPRGTTRIARALTSEIVALDAVMGQRPGGKLDVHDVSAAIALVETNDERRFAVAPAGEKAKGSRKPSELGYGNVTPSLAQHGGITMSRAEQRTVISLVALRSTKARALGGTPDAERDLAGRLLLVALALMMLEAQIDAGWDLRSGCQLVPAAEPQLELVDRLGQTTKSWGMFDLGAEDLLRSLTAKAEASGLDWTVPPLELTASDEQMEILRRSAGLGHPA